MTEQLALDLVSLEPVPHVPNLDERFRLFHEANPHVYRALATLARRLVARGRRRVGVKMLFEVLRYEYMLATDDPTSDYRLNNSFTSRYARILMDNEPDLTGMFETRELRS